MKPVNLMDPEQHFYKTRSSKCSHGTDYLLLPYRVLHYASIQAIFSFGPEIKAGRIEAFQQYISSEKGVTTPDNSSLRFCKISLMVLLMQIFCRPEKNSDYVTHGPRAKILVGLE